MCGDVVEIFLVLRDECVLRVEFFGDEVECIWEVNVLIGEVLGEMEYVVIFLVIYFVMNDEYMEYVVVNIKVELE